MQPESFEIGKVYFEGSFLHPRYPIPEIETWIYVGRNLFADEAEDENVYYFINPQKYYEADLKAAVRDEAFFDEIDGYYLVRESDLEAMMDLEELLGWMASLKQADNADQVFSAYG